MSALAKVFVVVNLVLSLLFFGTSSTLLLTRVDLKKRLTQASLEYDRAKRGLEDELVLIKGRTAEQGKALQALKTSEAKLSADLDVARQEITAAQARADTAESARREAERLASTANERLTANENRIQELERQLQEAVTRRDAAVASAQAAVEERNRMARDLEQTNKELQQQKIAFVDLQNEYDELELRHRALEGGGPVPARIPVPLDAMVEAVNPELKAVVLSVGSDQEVKMGDEFTIHRRGRFVGKVKVIKLYRDLSGARVLFEQDGMSIEAGDSATTRVSTVSS